MNSYFMEQERPFLKKKVVKKAAFGAEAEPDERATEASGVTPGEETKMPPEVGLECKLYANFFKVVNHPNL